jgi:hypothetical protein
MFGLGKKKETTRISLGKGIRRNFQKSPVSSTSKNVGQGVSVNNNITGDLRKVLLYSPMLFGAISKKSKDMIYSWFEWSEETPEYIVKTSKRWKNVLKTTLQGMLFNAYWSGDGFAEKIYAPDNGTPESKPPEGAKIANFKVIDPMTVFDIEDGFLVLRGFVGKNLTTVKLHPDRYIRITPHKIGDDNRGVSPIDVAFKVAISVMNADEAYGEYIYRQGNGFMILNIDQANQTEIDEAWDNLGKIQKGFVGSERHDFDIQAPRTFEGREFNFYFYRSLAAVLEMPVSMFIGQNTGDVDIRDDRGEYYSRIAGTQKVILTPVIKKLLTELLGLNDIQHEIVWNPIYVDPRSQGERARYMASAARMLAVSLKENPELMTVDEARAILGLPPIAEPTPQEPALPPKAMSPLPIVFEETFLDTHRLEGIEIDDKFVIEGIKKLAEKERKLGEKIIEEQENGSS